MVGLSDYLCPPTEWLAYTVGVTGAAMSSREDSYHGVLLIMHCLITETWVLPRSGGPTTGQNIDPVVPCLSGSHLCSLCSPLSLLWSLHQDGTDS